MGRKGGGRGASWGQEVGIRRAWPPRAGCYTRKTNPLDAEQGSQLKNTMFLREFIGLLLQSGSPQAHELPAEQQTLPMH